MSMAFTARLVVTWAASTTAASAEMVISCCAVGSTRAALMVRIWPVDRLIPVWR